MPSRTATTILRYTKGTSFKEYRVTLHIEQDGMASVTTKYGRIGTALNAGQSVIGLTPYGAQHRVDRIIREKVRKGYEIHDTTQRIIADDSAQPLSAVDAKALTNTITNAIATRKRTFHVAL